MIITQKDFGERISLLLFPKQRDAGISLLRFQEHYESPQFRGKFFSLEEYKQWYIQNSPKGRKTGKFTYYSDWSGFNFPSNIIIPFFNGHFDPLSREEERVLDTFRNRDHPFYIIGTFKENPKLREILKHEIAHGLFYTDQEYKLTVLETLSLEDISKFKQSLISSAGYHKDVLLDEVHAYLLNSNKPQKNNIYSERLRVKLEMLFIEALKRNKINLE